MLDGDLLGDANGYLQTVREGLRLFGPLTGAALFAAFGGGTVAVMDSATFVIAAAALCMVHVDEPKPTPTEQHRWAEVTAGVRHIWNHVVLRQVVITTALACLVIGFFESISFAIVGQGLHRTPPFLGVLIAVQGIGALAGGIMSARSVRRLGEGPIVGIGLLMLAAGAILMMFADLPLVFAGAIVLGASLPLIIVAFMTLLQRRTPNELQGRVSSAADTLTSVPQTASIAVGAVLVSQVNYRYLLASIAVVVTLTAVYLLTRHEQWVREPELDAAGDAAVAQLDEGSFALAAEAERFLPGGPAATFEAPDGAAAASETTETR
jgi:predicted MFS family arabinose efflux permease